MSHDTAVATMAAERYLLDELTEAERDTFEEHYFTCPECAEEVRAGEAMRREMQDVFLVTRERAPLPFRPPARRWFHSTGVLPWAVAAVLVLAVGYQSAVVIPSLRGLSDAQVLSPLVLRPASRGAVPVVTVDAGVRFVSLSFEARRWASVSGSSLDTVSSWFFEATTTVSFSLAARRWASSSNWRTTRT